MGKYWCKGVKWENTGSKGLNGKIKSTSKVGNNKGMYKNKTFHDLRGFNLLFT